MKAITFTLLTAALVMAQDRSGVASPDAARVLPKGASEVEPNLYRYTDSEGRNWLARRTPFGFSTWEDKPEPPRPASQPASQMDATPIQASDLGDSVRFARQTPFGVSTWTRKKTELNTEEREWLAGAQKAAPMGQVKPLQTPGNATEKQ